MKNSVCASVSLFAASVIGIQSACGGAMPIPFVKESRYGPQEVHLTGVTVSSNTEALGNEAAILKEHLADLQIPVSDGGYPIRLEIGPVSFPRITSVYQDAIAEQGYRLTVADSGIVLRAGSCAGIFYGIQTLTQLISEDRRLRSVEIVDWPDLARRMVMVDPARQNENMGYYRRLVQFCARYKINAIHVHLTDDQSACLYHEDYPWLMHRNAWRSEQVRSLADFARRYHIDLIPEIESLGHSRMFLRHPDFRGILHQTTKEPGKRWVGTEVPGYTNVLCPASDKTYAYLREMYGRAGTLFPYPELHIGCDEVDLTSCERCERKFGKIAHADWFLRHIVRCREIAIEHDRQMALWGDMLLSHRDIIDGLPPAHTIIYDWHYGADVSPESVAFFKEAGFEVIGCPALVCYPRMILPDSANLQNIERFARIAREHDLLGLDTTIWIPTRYMSDVLWPGIAYAAVHSWSGSNWNDAGFHKAFVHDYFGSPEGAAFARSWKDLCGIVWHRDDLYAACWIDENSLEQARTVLKRREPEIRGYLAKLERIQEELVRLRPSVSRNLVCWDAISRSAALRAYTMEHLQASVSVRDGNRWDVDRVRKLDAFCLQAIEWIEEDWDRNRFADDPNKNGVQMPSQHLLHRFKQMHDYHRAILSGGLDAQP